MQSGIKGAVVHRERAPGNGLNGLRQVPPIRRSALQEPENDKVQRALEEVGLAWSPSRASLDKP